MPPSPGKIQPLPSELAQSWPQLTPPVKVLYTIDTSPQSYLVVLPDKQDVYVHPTAPASTELLGSCSLKALARAICYAR